MGPGTILHVQYPSRTGYCRRPMINLLPALARFARPRHPVVVTMHEYHEHRLRWRARVLPMLLGQNALVAVRSVDYLLLAPWLRLARLPVAMVPNASNIPAARLSRRRSPDDPPRTGFRGIERRGAFVLAFFGDVRPDKGVHLFRSTRPKQSAARGSTPACWSSAPWATEPAKMSPLRARGPGADRGRPPSRLGDARPRRGFRSRGVAPGRRRPGGLSLHAGGLRESHQPPGRDRQRAAGAHHAGPLDAAGL